jgi:putative lipoic acid-binding regulatory protein
MSDPFNGEEIQFPVICHFKIIADNMPGVKTMLEKKLQDLGVVNPLSEGTHSAGNKYVTYNLEVKVGSKEYMMQLDQAIRHAPHVKMVL